MRIQNRVPARLPQENNVIPLNRRAENKPSTASAAASRANTVDVFTSAAPDVRSTFRQQFGELAADEKRFHDTMRTVFGEGYDVAKAERYRKQALAGDFSWLPPVKLVDPGTLGGAHGAYDAESGTVLLNRTLPPELAAATFVEEAGHHLDTQLNAKDTPGDEGELFRRILSGEKLSGAQLAAIRAENDKGIIYVDGKAKEVEFWNPFKAIGDAVKSVGNAIGEVAQRVGDGVRGLVTGVGNAVVGIVRNVGEGLGDFFGGVGKLFTGKFIDGLKQMGQGLVKTVIQTPVDALLMVGGRALSAIQTLIGVEPPGRGLKADEIAVLRQVYGDSIDYGAVRIKEGNSGLFSTTGRAFAHGNTIYIPPENLPLTKDLLVHEMAHVWQNQNGGTDYMSEALWGQYHGDGYDFEKGLKEGKAWSELNPEQQAELLQQAYLAGYFNGPGQRFVYNGTDYTDYMNDVMKQVRAGKGAP